MNLENLKKLDKARNSTIVTTKIPGYRIWITLASFFGAGYAPSGSGTVGTILAFIFLFIIGYRNPVFAFSIPYMIACVLIIPLGSLISEKGRQMWGEDASRIVIDEVAGMMWAVLFFRFSIPEFIGLFFLFRLFDIFKLPPGKQIDSRLHNGWGILLDDVVAGIYANLTMRLIVFTLSYIGCCERLFAK